MNNQDNFIHIYTFNGVDSIFDIKPASVKRDFMDMTNGSAYHCLPLNIANQYGWVAHSPSSFSATWDGRYTTDAIKIDKEDPLFDRAQSHFGFGVLTIALDFVIQTSKSTSLYIRGLTNTENKNVYPLDGIVETDWLPFSFTFNYKFHTPGTVTFKKGDPLFMFFPVERGFIDSFKIETKNIYENEEFYNDYKEYSRERNKAIDEKHEKPQRFYKKGKSVDKKIDIENHQLSLSLNKLRSYDE